MLNANKEQTWLARVMNHSHIIIHYPYTVTYSITNLIDQFLIPTYYSQFQFVNPFVVEPE